MLKTNPTAWLGDVAELSDYSEVYHEHHSTLDVLHLAGSLSFDDWVEAAELLENFTRPVFVVFDSAVQESQGWTLLVQAVDLVRHQKRLPVAVLLLDGLGRGIELAGMADVTFVLPTSRIGQYGARLVSGELATGWRWDGRRPPPGRHWNVSAKTLTWLRDHTLTAEAAEHHLGVLIARDERHAIETFAAITKENPRR